MVLYEQILDPRCGVGVLHVDPKFFRDDFVEFREGDDFFRLFRLGFEEFPEEVFRQVFDRGDSVYEAESDG